MSTPSLVYVEHSSRIERVYNLRGMEFSDRVYQPQVIIVFKDGKFEQQSYRDGNGREFYPTTRETFMLAPIILDAINKFEAALAAQPLPASV